MWWVVRFWKRICIELYQEVATSRGSPSKSPSNCGYGRSKFASGRVELPYCESGSLKIAGPALYAQLVPLNSEQNGFVTGVASESDGSPVPPIARKFGSFLSLASSADETKSRLRVLEYPPNGRCVLRLAE